VTYITEEILGLVDVEGPVTTARVSEDSLRRFVQAAMEEDPIHWDDDAARERGFEGVVAPPLYPTNAFRRASGTPDPLDRLKEVPDWDGTSPGFGGLPPLGIPLVRILNGGTEAEFFQLPRLDDDLNAQSRYVSITERDGRSGPMVLALVETVYTNQDNAVLARVRQTIIHR
jgi:acyl dehydratase